MRELNDVNFRFCAFNASALRSALALCLLLASTGLTSHTDAADEAIPPTARQEFNLGSQSLHQDLDRAETLLMSARERSGKDGELRFRSTYNLGWLEVKRADSKMDAAPEEALPFLSKRAEVYKVGM